MYDENCYVVYGILEKRYSDVMVCIDPEYFINNDYNVEVYYSQFIPVYGLPRIQ